jgi:hypothetical protein
VQIGNATVNDSVTVGGSATENVVPMAVVCPDRATAVSSNDFTFSFINTSTGLATCQVNNWEVGDSSCQETGATLLNGFCYQAVDGCGRMNRSAVHKYHIKGIEDITGRKDSCHTQECAPGYHCDRKRADSNVVHSGEIGFCKKADSIVWNPTIPPASGPPACNPVGTGVDDGCDNDMEVDAKCIGATYTCNAADPVCPSGFEPVGSIVVPDQAGYRCEFSGASSSCKKFRFCKQMACTGPACATTAVASASPGTCSIQASGVCQMPGPSPAGEGGNESPKGPEENCPVFQASTYNCSGPMPTTAVAPTPDPSKGIWSCSSATSSNSPPPLSIPEVLDPTCNVGDTQIIRKQRRYFGYVADTPNNWAPGLGNFGQLRDLIITGEAKYELQSFSCVPRTDIPKYCRGDIRLDNTYCAGQWKSSDYVSLTLPANKTYKSCLLEIIIKKANDYAATLDDGNPTTTEPTWIEVVQDDTLRASMDAWNWGKDIRCSQVDAASDTSTTVPIFIPYDAATQACDEYTPP